MSIKIDDWAQGHIRVYRIDARRGCERGRMHASSTSTSRVHVRDAGNDGYTTREGCTVICSTQTIQANDRIIPPGRES